MAKGQIKGNKEAKKPKADKPKGSVSAYKQSQGKGGPSLRKRSSDSRRAWSRAPEMDALPAPGYQFRDHPRSRISRDLSRFQSRAFSVSRLS